MVAMTAIASVRKGHHGVQLSATEGHVLIWSGQHSYDP